MTAFGGIIGFPQLDTTGQILPGIGPVSVIMDWELFKEEVPADMRLVRPSVERAESALEVGIKGLVTDRGFDNKANIKWPESPSM